MTFLTILGVMKMCSFRLVLEGKIDKEISESVLEKFLASNFADTEDNTRWQNQMQKTTPPVR